jgi:hypothetical protein
MRAIGEAEAPVIRTGLSPRWGRTTTTTIEVGEPNIPATSEIAPKHIVPTHFLVAWLAQRTLRVVPQNIGRVLLYEGAPNQVGIFEDAIAGSNILSHSLASSFWNCFSIPSYCRALLPSAVDQNEVLNWDAAIEVPPSRPSGTIAVTLKYAGRAKPTPVDDPLD